MELLPLRLPPRKYGLDDDDDWYMDEWVGNGDPGRLVKSSKASSSPSCAGSGMGESIIGAIKLILKERNVLDGKRQSSRQRISLDRGRNTAREIKPDKRHLTDIREGQSYRRTGSWFPTCFLRPWLEFF